MKRNLSNVNYQFSAPLRQVSAIFRKFLVAVIVLTVTAIGPALGQKPDYRVVFDLTSRDTADYRSLVRWIREITASNADAQIEIVLYGGSLDMVVKQRSTVADAVSKLMDNKNVQFKVCAQAMRNHQIGQEELLPGVGIVPDGIYEIISRQRQGWGYIKAGH